MYWVIDSAPEIRGTNDNLQARAEYIKEVTNSAVTPWFPLRSMLWQHGPLKKSSQDPLYCQSGEGINGLFITAHVYNVVRIVCNELFKGQNLVVANTCKIQDTKVRDILWFLQQYNPEAQLLFAKQDSPSKTTASISNTGTFGFPTTRSERILYRTCICTPAIWTRTSRLENALYTAFDQVSLL